MSKIRIKRIFLWNGHKIFWVGGILIESGDSKQRIFLRVALSPVFKNSVENGQSQGKVCEKFSNFEMDIEWQPWGEFNNANVCER